MNADGPRIIQSTGYAESKAGRVIQSDELKQQAGKASAALLTVAILQAIFGTIIVVLAQTTTRSVALSHGGVELQLSPVLYVTVYGIAVLFFGLFLWARKSPLPAAIVGLVVFVTLHLLDALADPTALARGILVKVIIIFVLVRAIKAGLRHRELLRQSQGS